MGIEQVTQILIKYAGGKGSGFHGHAGVIGQRGGSAKRSGVFSGFVDAIEEPNTVQSLGRSVKKNLLNREIKRKKLFEEMGLPFKSVTKYDTRVPGIEMKGKFVFGKTSGSHRDMKPRGEHESWEDDKMRFGFVFDDNFSDITEIQFLQGATGVDYRDKAYEDKSMKKIYNTMKKLSVRYPELSGKKVTIELDELDDNGFPAVLESTL